MMDRSVKNLLARAALVLSVICAPALSQAAAPAAGDPAGYNWPPRMGQWVRYNSNILNPLPEDQGWERKYYGVVRHTGTWFGPILHTKSGQFLWTSYGFEDMGDQPQGWAGYSRMGIKVPTDAKGLIAYNFMPTIKGSPKGISPDPNYKAWTPQAAKYELTADKKNRYSLPGTTDVITFDEKTLEMNVNGGQMQLKGKLVSPGTQQMWPWRDTDGGTTAMLYSTQWYAVEGTYYGEPVSGMVPVEQIWGEQNYVNTWWVKHRDYYLILFATTYDDGITESGVITCERLTGRGAVIADSTGKAALNTAEMNMTTAQNAAGKTNHAIYSFRDSPDWEFVAEPQSEGMFYEFGTVKRVGEKRKVVRSAALQAGEGKTCEARPFGKP